MAPMEGVLLWAQTFTGDASRWEEQKPTSHCVWNREGQTLLEPSTVPGLG